MSGSSCRPLGLVLEAVNVLFAIQIEVKIVTEPTPQNNKGAVWLIDWLYVLYYYLIKLVYFILSPKGLEKCLRYK